LESRGFTCRPFVPGKTRLTQRAAVLVGAVPPTPENLAGWEALQAAIKAGAKTLILSVEPFCSTPDKPRTLPWGDTVKARGWFHDWLYHRESVGRRHAVFAGLQSGGILDWHYWGGVVGHASFDASTKVDEVIAATFAVGYCCDGGYDTGLLIAQRRWGKGRLMLNALPLLDHLGKHPAADRLLLNLIAAAKEEPQGRPR
jgi:hypothetical protein